LAALLADKPSVPQAAKMPSAHSPPPPAALFLITPRVSAADARAFAQTFAEVLAAAPIASALLRLAPGADVKAILPSFLAAATKRDCALILDEDPRLAARLGADGVQVTGAGDALDAALDSLKPERIVGVCGLRSRDDAMWAGEKGADYVMFGEPRGEGPPQALDALLERIGWWAEIFETPCVAYAESIEAAGALARVGADFVALGDVVWGDASPAGAIRRAKAALEQAAIDRAAGSSQ
jgi:thiamine-phosphate pyrophosphorylase